MGESLLAVAAQSFISTRETPFDFNDYEQINQFKNKKEPMTHLLTYQVGVAAK